MDLQSVFAYCSDLIKCAAADGDAEHMPLCSLQLSCRETDHESYVWAAQLPKVGPAAAAVACDTVLTALASRSCGRP